MFYLSVITVHKTYKVALVKCKDIYARTIIQAVYIIGMFYYHHPFGRTLADKIVGKPLLVIAGKLIFRISAELAVIRRIEKYEVILIRSMFKEEPLEIKIAYMCGGKLVGQLPRPVILHLFVKILTVICNTAVRHIKLTVTVIAEHTAVAIIAYKQKQRTMFRRIEHLKDIIIVQMPEIHVERTLDGCLDIV